MTPTCADAWFPYDRAVEVKSCGRAYVIHL